MLHYLTNLLGLLDLIFLTIDIFLYLLPLELPHLHHLFSLSTQEPKVLLLPNIDLVWRRQPLEWSKFSLGYASTTCDSWYSLARVDVCCTRSQRWAYLRVVHGYKVCWLIDWLKVHSWSSCLRWWLTNWFPGATSTLSGAGPSCPSFGSPFVRCHHIANLVVKPRRDLELILFRGLIPYVPDSRNRLFCRRVIVEPRNQVSVTLDPRIVSNLESSCRCCGGRIHSSLCDHVHCLIGRHWAHQFGVVSVVTYPVCILLCQVLVRNTQSWLIHGELALHHFLVEVSLNWFKGINLNWMVEIYVLLPLILFSLILISFWNRTNLNCVGLMRLNPIKLLLW